jgi:serralysin
MAEFTGGAGPDVFTGTSDNDSFLLQSGGTDQASGLDGNDGVYFGAALTASDIVDGGLGTDTVAIQGNYAALTLGAITNVEVLFPMPGNDTRFGDLAGNLYSYNITTTDANLAAGRILQLIGGNLRPGENLTFNGSAETDGNFRIFAGQGNDNLRGGGGSDGFFFGQDGNLTGADRVDGGGGTDSIALRGNYFGAGAVVFQNASFTNVEVLVLLSGHTNEFGGFINLAGFDYDLTMADGTTAAGIRLDVIATNLRSNESVTFNGSAETNGSFRVLSGAGTDSLIGSNGDDFLFGGDGADRLDGGLGADRLEGAAGADVFVFATAPGAANIDTLPDFSLPQGDRIELGGATGQGFAGLASGVLADFAFAIGTSAADVDDRILYDPTTGALRYDPDGTGAAAAIQFATLPTGLALTAASFTVAGPANAAPVISSGTTASVAEGVPASTLVYQTAASDTDGDTIIYRIGGSDAASFTIDQNGAVRITSVPDFETKASYQFSVTAQDTSGASSVRNVTLTITDVVEGGGGSTPVVTETGGANGSIAQAQVIARNVLQVATNAELFDDALPSLRIQGSITPATELDFYSITLQAGELLILDVDNPVANLDSLIRLYDNGGSQLFFRDDAWRDPGSAVHPSFEANSYDTFLWFVAPTSSTYYFSIESWGEGYESGPGTGDTSGPYRLNLSIDAAPSETRILGLDSLALNSGYAQADNQVTYSFPNSVAQYAGYPSGASEDLLGLTQFTSLQQGATNALLQLVADVSGLTFQAQSPSATELRYAMNDTNDAAYAYYPIDGSSASGAAWFNKSSFNSPAKGNYAWMGILHETGHTLGLKHGQDFPELTTPHDSLEYSVMTYRSYVGDPLSSGYSNETWGYPQTLMMFDIAALQRLYGANFGFNATDTVYSWSADTGEAFFNGTGQGAPGGNRVFMTIWDGGGTDTYDLSNYVSATVIDLRPGQWTTTAPAQRANLGDGNFARGNVANALLFDDDPRSLIENAIGGSFNDTIIANQAANRLTGGGGSDTFRWTTLTDAAAGTADHVTDFSNVAGDKIDLGGIDANSPTPGDDSFAFIGTGAFNGTPGQLRYEVISGNLHLLGDVDGNGVADLQIIFDNITSLAVTDFAVL